LLPSQGRASAQQQKGFAPCCPPRGAERRHRRDTQKRKSCARAEQRLLREKQLDHCVGRQHLTVASKYQRQLAREQDAVAQECKESRCRHAALLFACYKKTKALDQMLIGRRVPAQLCRYFEKNGSCLRGIRCGFLHPAANAQPYVYPERKNHRRMRRRLRLASKMLQFPIASSMFTALIEEPSSISAAVQPEPTVEVAEEATTVSNAAAVRSVGSSASYVRARLATLPPHFNDTMVRNVLQSVRRLNIARCPSFGFCLGSATCDVPAGEFDSYNALCAANGWTLSAAI
jgi:hypothetical protein